MDTAFGLYVKNKLNKYLENHFHVFLCWVSLSLSPESSPLEVKLWLDYFVIYLLLVCLAFFDDLD